MTAILGTILSTTSIALASDITSQITNGGNTTGAAIRIGTNDNFALELETNNVLRATLSTAGDWTMTGNVDLADDKYLRTSGGGLFGYSSSLGRLEIGSPSDDLNTRLTSWGNIIDLIDGEIDYTSTLHFFSGNINVNGNLTLSAAGNGLYIKEGTNATSGVATLTGGTVVVNTTKVTANSRIQLTGQGGNIVNLGSYSVTARTAGTSFTITSSNVLDSNTVAWVIIENA